MGRKDRTMHDRIYEDIAKRTGGDIYIGVVGPVRTGKSTFIHRFLDRLVIPSIEDENDRRRTVDQMPQSAQGRTVMTTEPKFIPDESVRITVDGGTELNVKLIDCVGYMVDGALGATEDGAERMVMTPWSDEPIPFARASEIGTCRVIAEHSTIGMLVTTDGTITDLPRESYIEAERRAVEELKRVGKPFALLLNSANPNSAQAHTLAEELEKEYEVPVALISAPELEREDIKQILSLVLGEFPVKQLKIRLPRWINALPEGHSVTEGLYSRIGAIADGIRRISDITPQADEQGAEGVSVNAGNGTAEMSLPLPSEVYYETLTELCGIPLSSEGDVLRAMVELSAIGEKYKKVEGALTEAAAKGYGIVMPSVEDLELEESRVIKQQNGYGVRVVARGEALHVIKTEVNTELCPLVGTEEQSREIADHLNAEDRDGGVWESNMLGRTLYSLVSDGMNAKLLHLPDDAREKLAGTLGRIVNEGAGGLICILL